MTATKIKVEDIERVLNEGDEGEQPKPAPRKAAAKKAPPKAPAKKATAAKSQPKPSTSKPTTVRPAEEAPQTNSYELKVFTQRDVPWMKICPTFEGGKVVTSAKAAELGGLNFDVELLECGFVTPKGTTLHKVDSRRACVRKDTRQFFSFVSKGYHPIQYAEAFAFMDEVSPNYVAAGTLGGGRQGFMIVQLPEHAHKNLKLADGQVDPFDLYVVLRTSHDLTRALEVSVLGLRGKCMNALSLRSFTHGAAQHWSIKHVGKDPLAKLNAARLTLSHTEAYVKELEGIALNLSEIKLDVEAAKDVLKKLLPDRPKREEQVNHIVHAWQESPTNGFRDNGWGLVNAVSEYFEWGRPDGTRTSQSRFTGGLTGSTARYSNRAAQLLIRRR